MSLFKPSAVALALGTLAGSFLDVAAAPAAERAQEAKTRPPPENVSMERLRALKVFEVGELIVKNPSELTSCYGICPGSEGEKQAQRLADLAAKAEAAAKKAAPAGACDERQINSNLQTLRALKILKVGELIRDKPVSSPRCYGQPCPEDVEKAKVATCQHAGQLANIAADAKGL